MPSHILVAEDQVDIRDLIVLNLQQAGHAVTAVADGRAALASQEERASDLLILDLMMPLLDGLEVCKALRARGRATPILMLTAKSTELDRVLGLELGADDYLTKPFSMAELLARVKALLRRAELLRQQMRAADDAVAMLDQFSEFSAIEQGALQSHPELVDLREVLDGVAASLQATHPPALLRLSVHGRHQWLHTDRTQLARLVQNLAGNAVRYSLGPLPGRPGQPARVVLAVRPQRASDGSEGLVIDVLDNGRGIPADKLEAVFKPYVQLADGGGATQGASRGGRGLGLAIVRGLAAQLGLQLAPLRSTLGQGTRFRVQVPAALRRAGPQPLAPGAAAGSPVAPDASRLDGWLLALLDDEPGTRAALRAALESAGATLVDAGSLEQLKLLLDAEPRFPDALVFDLDLGTGKADGLAAVMELRAEWEMLVPAVIVTGRIAVMGTVPLPKRCTLLGKPVALATLVGTLRLMAPKSAP